MTAVPNASEPPQYHTHLFNCQLDPAELSSTWNLWADPPAGAVLGSRPRWRGCDHVMTMPRTWDTTTTTLEKLRATKRPGPHAPWHWNPFPLELEIVPWVLKPVVWCLIPCPCCWNPCPWSRNPPPLELELGPLMLEPVLLLLKPMPLLPEPAPLKLEPAPLKLEPAPPLNLDLFVKAIF